MNKFALALLVGTISAATYETTPTGPKFSITYDDAAKKYMFGADVAVGNDLWLAYSTDCTRTSCDIVEFLTSGNGSVKDAYGTVATPRTDFINDYKNSQITKNGDIMNFSTERSPAPTDTIGKDVQFNCGSENTYTWLVKPSGDTGTWNFKLNEDCSVWEAPKPAPAPAPGAEAAGEEPTGASYLAAATTITTAAVLVSLF